jgi:hypothetical protein
MTKFNKVAASMCASALFITALCSIATFFERNPEYFVPFLGILGILITFVVFSFAFYQLVFRGMK